MAGSIKLSTENWAKLRQRLKQEYAWKPSIIMIRSTMLRELGFTPRLHVEQSKEQYMEIVYLDFYDDKLETLFRLKYSEYLNV